MDTAAIFENATALVPEIRQRADEVAAHRRLPADLVASLKQAGVFRMPMPHVWGGPEMSLPDQVRLVELLSAADPSVGWCVMIGSDAGFYSSFLDDAAGRELWPDLDMVTAGWIVPAGRARPVDGGYVVSGRWAFGSGCTHADVLLGGCLVVDDGGMPVPGPDGAPIVRNVVAPAASWEIHDTWFTTGLAGSGSNDYSCEHLFVPAEHTFSFADPVRRAGALYQFPGAFVANAQGVALGLARRAIDEVTGIARTKVLLPQFVNMRDVPRVREALADAESSLRAARAYVYDTLEELWARLEGGAPLTDQQRVDLVLSRRRAFRASREIALAMMELAGTQAIYATSVLDRLVRDALTINQHVIAGSLVNEVAGGLLLGEAPTGPMAALF